jgi:hypothetical protein
MNAVIALVEVPAERGSSTLLDCTQHSALLSAGRVLLQKCFAVPLYQIGDFKRWP